MSNLDSSVAFQWVVQETLSAKAVQLRIDFQNAVHELFAPAIFTVELAHTLTQDLAAMQSHAASSCNALTFFSCGDNTISSNLVPSECE
jgi:uncharacterized membrane-anchored protein YhcB (DUF1043 family)